MAQCHYHPDARGSANCPTCKHHICDKCRMRGTPERCMTCQSNHARGGSEATRAKREMCTNHPDVPSDMRCVRCRKIHCPACLNGASKCFRCALLPNPGENRGTGNLKGGGTGKLRGGGTGALRKPARLPFYKTHGFKQVGGGLVVLVGCFFALKAVAPSLGLQIPGLTAKAPPKPYTGVGGVEIVSPKASSLTGNQVLKFKVAAADHLDRLEVTVDGKHWERLKKAPFESEWQTQIFSNGHHMVVARAVYRGGKKIATAKRKFKTKNRV
jgi:hypothetical protein